MSDQARAARARAEALVIDLQTLVVRREDCVLTLRNPHDDEMLFGLEDAIEAVLRYRDEVRREALAPIVELRALSTAVDNADGATEYQIRLIALAGTTRSVLRRLNEPV